jgi:hypothetical protein
VAVRVNDRSYEHAQRLINNERYVLDGRDDWSEHQPTAKRENELVAEHGFDEYRKWYLAEDDEEAEGTKARYKFPYGDFERVHRCGVLAAESRAGQYRYPQVEAAAAHLHGMLEGVR